MEAYLLKAFSQGSWHKLYSNEFSRRDHRSNYHTTLLPRRRVRGVAFILKTPLMLSAVSSKIIYVSNFQRGYYNGFILRRVTPAIRDH